MLHLSTSNVSFLQNRFFVLLTSIVLLIVVGPFLQEHAVTKWLVGLTSVAILGGVIYSVKEKTRYLKLFVLLASVTLVLYFLDIYTNFTYLHIAYLCFFILFIVVSIVDLNEEIFKEDNVTKDILYGSVCGYLLLIVMYGSLHMLLETIAPGSYHHSVNWESADFTTHQMYYYSTITITTLGYGDIIPVSVLAKSIAMLECISGVFYIAILVSRLIGMQRNS